MDRITQQKRSANMAAVRSRDTKPEIIVRKIVHSLGYRFRLHEKSLPGTPDLVFTRKRKVIFVHGCFWHRHVGCSKASTPQTRTDFWQQKFDANTARDERAIGNLEKTGWSVLVVWQCQLKDIKTLRNRLDDFLRIDVSAVGKIPK